MKILQNGGKKEKTSNCTVFIFLNEHFSRNANTLKRCNKCTYQRERERGGGGGGGGRSQKSLVCVKAYAIYPQVHSSMAYGCVLAYYSHAQNETSTAAFLYFSRIIIVIARPPRSKSSNFTCPQEIINSKEEKRKSKRQNHCVGFIARDFLKAAPQQRGHSPKSHAMPWYSLGCQRNPFPEAATVELHRVLLAELQVRQFFRTKVRLLPTKKKRNGKCNKQGNSNHLGCLVSQSRQLQDHRTCSSVTPAQHC